MHSTGDNDPLFACSRFWIVFVGDRQVLAPVSSEGAAKSVSSEKLRDSLIVLKFFQVLQQVRVGVGAGVREEHRVLVVLERVGEAQRVVVSLAVAERLPTERVRVVLNIVAVSVPAEVRLLCLLGTVHEHLHAVVVERGRL